MTMVLAGAGSQIIGFIAESEWEELNKSQILPRNQTKLEYRLSRGRENILSPF